MKAGARFFQSVTPALLRKNEAAATFCLAEPRWLHGRVDSTSWQTVKGGNTHLVWARAAATAGATAFQVTSGVGPLAWVDDRESRKIRDRSSNTT